jgi:hypothetical protein
MGNDSSSLSSSARSVIRCGIVSPLSHNVITSRSCCSIALSCCGRTVSCGLRRRDSSVSRPRGWSSLRSMCRVTAHPTLLAQYPDRPHGGNKPRPARLLAPRYGRNDRGKFDKTPDRRPTAEAGGSTFYGGDLDGISEKLPYLKQLGVTALYLNPVFVAPNHGCESPVWLNTPSRIRRIPSRCVLWRRRSSAASPPPGGGGA